MKKMVDTELTEVKDSLDGATLNEVLVKVQQWIAVLGGESKLSIGTQSYPYENYEYACVRIMGMREEADDVYNERLANEARWAKQQEDRDAAEYKRLQEKFGAK